MSGRLPVAVQVDAPWMLPFLLVGGAVALRQRRELGRRFALTMVAPDPPGWLVTACTGVVTFMAALSALLGLAGLPILLL
jgi:hypothetical protein